MSEVQPSGLRALLAVAEQGSFTAAAAAIGYSQSAVSRQIAALEAAVGTPLFERRRHGVNLNAAGARFLPRARSILEELDGALADARAEPHGRVRLGAFPISLVALVPDLLIHLQRTNPHLEIQVREGTTPRLVRAVRAGSLDLAIVARVPPFRPVDHESPPLETSLLLEQELTVAVGPDHPLASRETVDVAELVGNVWVAGGPGGDPLLGVWPGLPERAEVRYVVEDWLAKLRLVEAGLAITTAARSMEGSLPAGVTLVSVRDGSREARRICSVRLPGPPPPGLASVLDALGVVAARAVGEVPSSPLAADATPPGQWRTAPAQAGTARSGSRIGPWTGNGA